MRERTGQEVLLLRLGWINNTLEDALQGLSHNALNVFEYLIEYGLTIEETPTYNKHKWPQWSFEGCSITDEELGALCDRVQGPIEDSIRDREKRMYRLERMMADTNKLGVEK